MELILLSSLIGITFAAIIAAYAKVRGIGPYIYANARLNARGLYAIKGKEKELAKCKSLDELLAKLQNTTYYEILAESNNASEMHLALEKYVVNEIDEVKKIVPKETAELLDNFLVFYETPIIKTIYRAKVTNAEEDISKLCYAVGNINDVLLKHLLEAETIADIRVVMAETKYAEVFDKEYKSIEEFEIALDSFALRNFLKSLKKAKVGNKKEVERILRMKFDVQNLLALIKCVLRDVDYEKRKRLIVKGKHNWSNEAMDKMLKARSLEELEQALDGIFKRKFGELMQKYERNKNLAEVEIGLWKFYMEFVEKEEMMHNLGIIPIFTYLIKKEFEAKNLAAIIKGIDAKFKEEEILGLIV